MIRDAGEGVGEPDLRIDSIKLGDPPDGLVSDGRALGLVHAGELAPDMRADVDAITLSMARMETPVQLATQAILLAVAVNTASKATMAAWVGGLAVGLRVGGASAAALSAASAAYVGFG